MTGAITVKAEPTSGRVIISVDAPGFPTLPVVERNDGGGFAVRRYAQVLFNSTVLILADYEAPTDRPLTYRVAPSGPTAAPVVLPSLGQTWWKPLPYPSLSFKPQVLEALRGGDLDTETQTLWPLGATYPVTVAGARRSLKSKVVLATMTLAEEQRMADGLRLAPMALFQPPNGLPQQYLVLGAAKTNRHTRLVGDPVMIWEVTVTVTSSPTVAWAYPATATWRTHRDGSTWNEWRAGTWTDVLLGAM